MQFSTVFATLWPEYAFFLKNTQTKYCREEDSGQFFSIKLSCQLNSSQNVSNCFLRWLIPKKTDQIQALRETHCYYLALPEWRPDCYISFAARHPGLAYYENRKSRSALVRSNYSVYTLPSWRLAARRGPRRSPDRSSRGGSAGRSPPAVGNSAHPCRAAFSSRCSSAGSSAGRSPSAQT